MASRQSGWLQTKIAPLYIGLPETFTATRSLGLRRHSVPELRAHHLTTRKRPGQTPSQIITQTKMTLVALQAQQEGLLRGTA